MSISQYYLVNGPAPRTQESKVAYARNEWSSLPLVQRLRVRIALRIDIQSLYQSFSPPPPPALFKFPQQLERLSPLPLC